MKTHRMFIVAMLAGVLTFTAVQKAHAVDPYSQDILTNLLYGLVLGDPYAAQGNYPYGSYPPSYDPYRNAPYDPYGYDPYRNPSYGRYDSPYSYDSYGPDRRSYERPARGSYCPPPYASNRGRDYDYRYQDRGRRVESKYAKAMNRLDRQEAEARAKAYRKSHGDPSKYRKRMEKLDRKFAHKRDKVERNTARDYRKVSRWD